jgi:predicted Fe-Mo cluster-binding NifX family protein
MKICVASRAPALASDVDVRFGRARFFIIHDDRAGAYEVLDNEENTHAESDAGIDSAHTIAEKGCRWVVSNHVGPRAMTALRAAGIRVATGVSGKVADALRAFKKGELEELQEADVLPGR